MFLLKGEPGLYDYADCAALNQNATYDSESMRRFLLKQPCLSHDHLQAKNKTPTG